MSEKIATLGFIIEGEGKELAGSYVHALPLDDLVRLHVKALGFEVNKNRFMFKRGPLEAEHRTQFGTTIPAYKTFEGKLVNRNHWMTDQGQHSNHPIGFIERAYLKQDGVYLDLILWKRTLSDSELAQLRNNSCHVSMEVEYNQPRMIVNGIEQPLDKNLMGGKQVVRTMSDNSTLSFVGIAVLFAGIQPGDQNSGILVVENANLHDGVTFERTTNMGELTPISTPEGETMEIVTIEQFQQLQIELAAAQARIQEQDTAIEQAAVTQQELENQMAERDAKLKELYAKEEEYFAAQRELESMREKAYGENLAKCFDLEQFKSEELSFVKSLFSDLYGCAESEGFIERAALVSRIAAAATEAVKNFKNSDEEGNTDETSEATTEEVPAAEVTEPTTEGEETPAAGAEGVTVTDEAPAAEVPAAEAVTEEPVAEPVAAEETTPVTEQATTAPPAPATPAPSIAFSKKITDSKVDRRHLTF